MSFFTPAQKRRFAIERTGALLEFERTSKLNRWRIEHPDEWALISQNRGKTPFFDSLYAGLTRWGTLTNRQIHALQNFGCKQQKTSSLTANF